MLRLTVLYPRTTSLWIISANQHGELGARRQVKTQPRSPSTSTSSTTRSPAQALLTSLPVTPVVSNAQSRILPMMIQSLNLSRSLIFSQSWMSDTRNSTFLNMKVFWQTGVLFMLKVRWISRGTFTSNLELLKVLLVHS